MIRDRVYLILALLLFSAISYYYYGFFNLTDDTFIYLRYVQNFISFGEFSFNPGEKTYGVTSPLWYTILLFLTYLFDSPLIIPTVSSFIFAIFYICVWWRILTTYCIDPIKRLIIILIIIVDPNLIKHTYTGMETTASYFITLLIIYKVILKKNNFVLQGILFGMSILIRPDSIIMIISVLIFSKIKHGTVDWFKIILPTFLVIAPTIILSYYYMEELIPSTFFAKGGDYPLGRYFLRNFLSTISIITITYLPILICLILIFFRDKTSSLQSKQLLKFTSFLAFSYVLFYSLSISNEFVFQRYFSSVFPFFYLTLIEKIRIHDDLEQSKYTTILSIVIICFSLFITNVHSSTYKNVFTESEQIENELIEWVEKNTTENDVIYRDRIGKIGYYSNRIILDPVGLVNREISGYRLNGKIMNFFKDKNLSVLVAPKADDLEVIKKHSQATLVLIDSIKTRKNFLVREVLTDSKEQSRITSDNYLKIYRISWRN